MLKIFVLLYLCPDKIGKPFGVGKRIEILNFYIVF